MDKRSQRPIAYVMDIFGDHWTLLIVRDIALFGKSHFDELSTSAEKIPSSALTERLDRLVRFGIISKEQTPGGPSRQFSYKMTERGMELRPILLKMMNWKKEHFPASSD